MHLDNFVNRLNRSCTACSYQAELTKILAANCHKCIVNVWLKKKSHYQCISPLSIILGQKQSDISMTNGGIHFQLLANNYIASQQNYNETLFVNAASVVLNLIAFASFLRKDFFPQKEIKKKKRKSTPKKIPLQTKQICTNTVTQAKKSKCSFFWGGKSKLSVLQCFIFAQFLKC